MLHFSSDYEKGACPEILNALLKANDSAFSGYGTDTITASAKSKIRKACNCPEADIYFLSGGTQTNSTVIATMLKPYEGVISAVTGHISVHEAGAVEYTGHKVLTVPEHNGKIDAIELKEYIENFYNDGNHEHMIYPGMVYISHPTEYGTLYSATELKAIYSVCEEYDIPLFIDGARLGYGLMSKDTDVSLEYLAKHCDVFYIGGTKVGALLGEAVVFPKNNAPKQFYTMIKQHGAMLAKGWITGIQFDTLFTDDLYFNLSSNAIEMAEILKSIIKKHGIKEFLLSPTNQQFVVIENSLLDKIKDKVTYSFWEKYDENSTVIRLATSWYTTKEDMEALDNIFDVTM
ncbi:MAG: aminotransferase class V-fold PLP-dependent enzyme [Lachnospiraceae bacterium]|nr:aminotransferase class V-fold PLP-dependent enzyme [Lachnospiraceae bacterium]